MKVSSYCLHCSSLNGTFLLLCDTVNSAYEFLLSYLSLKSKQVTKTQISSPILNMKYTAKILQWIIGFNMTKIRSRKASGTMETYVNFADVSFFVTVLENRKKIWFVEVDCWFSDGSFTLSGTGPGGGGGSWIGNRTIWPSHVLVKMWQYES